MFITCPITYLVWQSVFKHKQLPHKNFTHLQEFYTWWMTRKGSLKFVPFYTTWEIWRARNANIFEAKCINTEDNISRIITWIGGRVTVQKAPRIWGQIYTEHRPLFPARYFDGAEKNHICGCGVLLRINHNTQYKIHWNGGTNINTTMKVLALWSLVWAAQQLALDTIHVYGDCQDIIQHLNMGKNFTPHS